MNHSRSLSGDSIVVISKGQLSSDLGGQQVILNPQSGIYYGLDAVGAFIWRALQTPCRISEIRDALMARYHIDTARAERDLIALLTDMRESGLIEIHDEPAI